MSSFHLEITLGQALGFSSALVKRKVIDKSTKLGAVVKANAYGHGAIEVSKVLEEENVDYICVAGLNEAVELRKNNIKLPILVMGYTPDDCLEIAIQNNITLWLRQDYT